MAINPDKLNEFVGKAVGDLGATLGAALVVDRRQARPLPGDEGSGPVTSAELATKTDTHERYVREWLAAQAAGGYVSYDPETGRYFLTEEQAECLTNEESPACVLGGFQAMLAAMQDLAEGDGRVPHGQGRRLARARRRPLSRHGALLPPRLQRESGRLVDPRSRRRPARSSSRARRSPTSAADTARRRSSSPRPSRKSKFRGFDYHKPSIDAATRSAHARPASPTA